MEDIDIWRSAQVLIDQHGAKALDVVAKRTSELREAGNGPAMAVWALIGMAVRDLLKQKPSASEPKN